MKDKSAPADSACWTKAKENFLEGLMSSKKPPSQENIDRFLKENFRLDKAISKCESLKMSADNQYKKSTGSRFVGKLLEVLLMVKEIGDPFLEFAPESVSIAWSAVSFLIQVGANDIENCGIIAEACTSIATVILNCRLYENRYSRSSKFDAGDHDTEKEIMNSIPGLLTLVLEFSWFIQNRLGEHKIFRSFKETFNPKLKDKYEEIQEEYKKLRSIAGDAFQERVMDMMDGLRKTHDDVQGKLFPALDDINSKLGEISDIKQILSEGQIRDQFTRNRAALRPSDTHEKQLNTVLNPLSHETDHLCEWLFEDKFYLSWEAKPLRKASEEAERTEKIEKVEKLENSESNETDETTAIRKICYIRGRPGFGKSVTVACALNRLSKPERKNSVCYFFFKKGDDATQTTRQAILSIAAQIFSDKFAPTKTEMENFNYKVEKMKEAAKEEEIAASASGDPLPRGGLLSKSTLKQLILELGKAHAKPIYLILDAIDECIDWESEELIEWLVELARSKEAMFKVLFSSRDSLGLETMFDLDAAEEDADGTNEPVGTNWDDDADDADENADEDEEDEDEDDEEDNQSSRELDDDAVMLTVSKKTNSADMKAYLTSSLTKLVTRRMVNHRSGGGKIVDVSRMVAGIMKKANGMFTYSAMVVASLGQPSPLSLAERLRRLPDGMDELYRKRLESLTTEERRLITLALKRVVWSFGDIGTIEIAEEFKQIYQREQDEDEAEEEGFEVESEEDAEEDEEQGNEDEDDQNEEDEEDEEGENNEEEEGAKENWLLQVPKDDDIEPTISVVDGDSVADTDVEPMYAWHQAYDDALDNPEIADTIYHLEQAGRDFFQFSTEKKAIDVIHKSVRDWVENESRRVAERDSNKVAISSLFTWDEKDQTIKFAMPIPASVIQSPNNTVDFQSERDSHLDIAVYTLRTLNNKTFQELYMPENILDENGDNDDEQADGTEDAGEEGENEEQDGGDEEMEESQENQAQNPSAVPKVKRRKNSYYNTTWDDGKTSENSDSDIGSLDSDGDSNQHAGDEIEAADPPELMADFMPAAGQVDSEVDVHFRYELVQWGQHLRRLEELFEPKERVGKKWDELWSEMKKFFEPTIFNLWCQQYLMFTMNESPEFASGKEMEPIRIIAQWGLTMVMEFILDVLKVDPNTAVTEGGTALITAFSNPKLTALLLKHNVDIMARGTSNRTAFQTVMCSGEFGQSPIELDNNTVEDLIEVAKLHIKAGADVNDITSMPNGRPPFHTAIAAGDLELFNLFVAHKVDINQADYSGRTPLHKVFVYASTAPEEDRLVMAKALLEAGAEVNAQDIDSIMPLYVAVSNQHQTGVELLIKHGADIHDEDALGLKAIHQVAVPSNYKDDETAMAIMELLLANGADLKSYSKIGDTPLDIAMENGYVGILKGLINKVIEQDGEDRSFLMRTDFAGKNLLHKVIGLEEEAGLEAAKAVCEKLSPDQVIEMLRQEEKEGNYTPLLWAAYEEMNTVVEYYISLGADLSITAPDGENVFSLVFENWLVNTLRDPEWLDQEGQEYTDKMEKLLISLIKSCPSLIQARGHKYLRGAIERGSSALVAILLEHKADPLVDDEEGWNCFDIAIAHKLRPPFMDSFGDAFLEYSDSKISNKQFKSPTKFSPKKKSVWLQLSENGLEIKEDGLPTETFEEEIVPAVVFADYPVPPQETLFYFELTLTFKDHDFTYVAIGLVADPTPNNRIPGLQNSETLSYAFHGDNERLYSTRNTDENHTFDDFQPSQFVTGDVIGCGWNRVGNCDQIFYTKNGEYLGVAFETSAGGGGKLWPAIGAKTEFTAKANFGEKPFAWSGLAEMKEQGLKS